MTPGLKDQIGPPDAKQIALDAFTPAQLIELAQEKQRGADYATAKAKQPQLNLPDDCLEELKAEITAEPEPAMLSPTGTDQLCQTVMDLVNGDGTVEDITHALVRVFRKVWHLQPHLGSIKG